MSPLGAHQFEWQMVRRAVPATQTRPGPSRGASARVAAGAVLRRLDGQRRRAQRPALLLRHRDSAGPAWIVISGAGRAD